VKQDGVWLRSGHEAGMMRRDTRVCSRPGCGQLIVFAVTEARKRQPLNADPDEAGNVAAWRDANGIWFARALTGDQRPGGGEKRMMPHAATCIADRSPGQPAALPANVISWETAAPAARARRARRASIAAGRGR
jgi:hypothetical protein